jgi:NDP-sugar pyrophosphorylase family protein
MKALIPAAGLGTRLGSLTRNIPKPMLPVGGRPLLEHIVELLRSHGITEIALNLHYKPDAILNHFGSGAAWGVRLRYSYEAELLGSAGTALRHLAWFYPEPFLVYYGGVYSDAHLSGLMQRHLISGAAATIAVYQAPDPTRYGAVLFDKNGRVRSFVEKPPADGASSHWANSGIYVLNPEVLHFVTNIPSDFESDVFPRLLDAGQMILAYPLTGTLIDIDTPENYQVVQQLFPAQGASSQSARLDIAPAPA